MSNCNLANGCPGCRASIIHNATYLLSNKASKISNLRLVEAYIYGPPELKQLAQPEVVKRNLTAADMTPIIQKLEAVKKYQPE